jgi:hypothetical protein
MLNPTPVLPKITRTVARILQFAWAKWQMAKRDRYGFTPENPQSVSKSALAIASMLVSRASPVHAYGSQLNNCKTPVIYLSHGYAARAEIAIAM